MNSQFDRNQNSLPGFRSLDVPAEFREHELLQRGPFLTLPNELLKPIVKQIGQERFNSALLDMEFKLSEICGSHSSYVGFWRSSGIEFSLLRRTALLPNTLRAEAASMWDKSATSLDAVLDIAANRLVWIASVRRGYCGWLMTNPLFIDEHNEIFASWDHEIQENGVPIMGPVVTDAMSMPERASVAKGGMLDFIKAFENFFIRWRLNGMPAPFLPAPIAVHFPVIHLRSVLGHMREGGTTFFMPDIFPVPSRDELRDIIEELLRGSDAPEHLADWSTIVAAGNASKNQISRYARIFEIQHYLRALVSRHASALKRKKSTLIVVLAEFLGVSDDTIEKDLASIDQRLGKRWYSATN